MAGTLPGATPVTVSHLDADLARLRAATPGRRIPIRLGTRLWHGDKSFLALRADVVHTRPVRGRRAALGYRLCRRPGDGTLVMVGAGTAHGLHPLPDGRSPFHFARTRLALVEPPHMHTSMVSCRDGDPCPAAGEEVDVQQPLTWVLPGSDPGYTDGCARLAHQPRLRCVGWTYVVMFAFALPTRCSRSSRARRR